MYYAHSQKTGSDPADLQNWHSLPEHLQSVARMAGHYASAFGWGPFGSILGALHDIGKYDPDFQRYIVHNGPRTTHAIGGGVALFHAMSEGSPRVPLVSSLRTHEMTALLLIDLVASHHTGLQHLSDLTRIARNPHQVSHYITMHPPSQLVEVWDRDLGVSMRERIELSAGTPASANFLHEWHKTMEHHEVGFQGHEHLVWQALFHLKMLLSCLVDADYADTANHFRHRPLPSLQTASPHWKQWAPSVPSDTSPLSKVKTLIQHRVQSAAHGERGIYTVDAPTGSGKTLALWKFALQHASTHQLDRIIWVTPYLNLSDQIEQDLGQWYNHDIPFRVLVDHSMASHVTSDQDYGTWIENWDMADVIITTDVRFFEMMASHTPSHLRALHRLSHSMIVLDEIHTAPMQWSWLGLLALNTLVDAYGASVVMGSATMPEWNRVWAIANHHRTHQPMTPADDPSPLRWHPIPVADLVSHWPRPNGAEWEYRVRDLVDLPTLVDEVRQRSPQAMIGVNTTRRVPEMITELIKQGVPSDHVIGMSSRFCHSHRQDQMSQIIAYQQRTEPYYVVATQVLQTGLDLDFPWVFRESAPLPDLWQSDGRRNRKKTTPDSKFVVFKHTDTTRSSFPSPDYMRKTTQTERLLMEYVAKGLSPYDPLVVQTYRKWVDEDEWDRYFRRWNTHRWVRALQTWDDEHLRDSLSWIDDQTAPHGQILVPYRPALFQHLYEGWQKNGVSRSWQQQARPLAVNVSTSWMTRHSQDVEWTSDRAWGFLLTSSLYSPLTGLHH